MNFNWILLIAASSGMIALSYEIVWYRAYSIVSWTSPAAFGLLLGAYLLGIAIGSALARVWCTKRQDTHDPRHLVALAAFLAISNLVSYAVVPALGYLVASAHWAKSLTMVAIATTCLGAILPLASHFGVSPDARVGKNLSYIYLANIAGSAIGSLLTGFVLMEYLSLRTIHVVLVFAGTFLSSALLLRASSRLFVAGGGIFALFALAFGVATLSHQHFEDLYARLIFKDKFSDKFKFSRVVENRSGVVAVMPNGAVFGSGAYDGFFNTNLLDDRNGIVRAYAALTFHPNPKNVLMIGLASGSWGQIIANHSSIERLTIIEINPAYLQLIKEHPEVSSLLDNPKVSIILDDGRRWLRRNPDRRFDGVVMNTTWHFRSSATNLLSREFLELVRSHLEPGGFAFYNTTQSDAVIKTGCTVFSHALQFSNFLAVSDSPIHLDPQRFESLVLAHRIDGKPVLDVSQPAAQTALANMLTQVRSAIPRDKLLTIHANADVVTDDNMVTEWKSKKIPYDIDPKAYLRTVFFDEY